MLLSRPILSVVRSVCVAAYRLTKHLLALRLALECLVPREWRMRPFTQYTRYMANSVIMIYG